jgi:hypothetical protein
MFGSAPLSIYFMSLGLSHFMVLDSSDLQKFKRLNRIALVAVLIRVFLSLEHKNIMAILLVNAFLLFEKGYLKKIRYWIVTALLLFFADYLFLKRLEGFGIIDFTLSYFKLGLVNYQLMIDTCSVHTYGFSTILGPLYFMFKFFNQPMPDFFVNSHYEWDWNPAQYLSSYAFQDFGYFYFILFYILGITLFHIDLKTLKQKAINSIAIYFVVLFSVVTFLFVPVIRGVEFWFSLLLPLLLIWLFTVRHHNRMKS